MRAFVVAAALSLMLAAAPAFAQAPAAAPAAPPAAQAAPAAEPAFPAGAKYAFVNIQRIAAESAQGKTLSLRVQALNTQKVNELNEKNKALQAAQQKLDSAASVLSDTARAQLAKDHRPPADRNSAVHRRCAEGSRGDAETSCKQSSSRSSVGHPAGRAGKEAGDFVQRT
jgi:Skp family chaperone for outer membrane proteins